jgi:adenine-specific DNA-methyltransferase
MERASLLFSNNEQQNDLYLGGTIVATLEDNKKRLLKLLKEMFQFDQADLDFGIYRIMNQKRDQINKFLNNDLIKQIDDELLHLEKNPNKDKIDTIKEKINVLERINDDGSLDEKIVSLREELKSYSSDSNLEDVSSDIYSRLSEFFSRYYDKGDFISQRRYKDGIYAIPYEGEEVKLHWANADQYYVKSSEYFTDYSFKEKYGKNVRFKLLEAKQEKDNNKGEKKTFQIVKDIETNPELIDGQLWIYFQYTDDKERQDTRTKEAVEFLAEKMQDRTYIDFVHLLTTAKKNEKSEMEKEIFRYTARNTYDYFIHKDLGEFLTRELDFFIKNDVIFMEDIDLYNDQKIREYMTKAKVIRNIAIQIIEFLAQIEDFQKKLWLKKKFVVETNYCITIDRIPESFYEEIAANDTQIDEWVNLFAIDKITAKPGDSSNPPTFGFSKPLTVEFLKQNPFLLVDTAFFNSTFKERLIGEFEEIDTEIDGVLVHSDNFQMLNLLSEKYKENVSCVYIDPPYNAKTSEILYKNTFKHSAWLTMMHNRLALSEKYLGNKSATIIAIDENEHDNLKVMLNKDLYTNNDFTSVSIVHNPAGIQGDNFSYSHEYAIFSFKQGQTVVGLTKRDDISIEPLRDWGGTSARSLAKNCFYPIVVKDNEIIEFGEVCDSEFHPSSSNVVREDGAVLVYPIDSHGVEKKWVFGRLDVESKKDLLFAEATKSGEVIIKRIKEFTSYKTVWNDKRYYANIHGSKYLNNILGGKKFSFPKSIYTVQDCIHAINEVREKNSIVMDYFAGSGTTGNAVINLNREDEGRRKYILAEMGEYFDTATKPRIQKNIYSKEWQDGQPIDREGISQAFKYIRLESYEDALNNIVFDNDSVYDLLHNNSFVSREYLLNYMLPIETKNSDSLLNIDKLAHPFDYQMLITKNGESDMRNIDIIETFNYLIGLHVDRNFALRTYDAIFEEGEYGNITAKLLSGTTYRIKMIQGITQKGEKALVIWRDLTGDIIKDNAILNGFFEEKRTELTNFVQDVIYVNGDNFLKNISDSRPLKVKLIDEEMKSRMFEMEG